MTLGYGRYKDDPDHVGCPRARTDMTPCVARDGALAVSQSFYGSDRCVGCRRDPLTLLDELAEVYPPARQTSGRPISKADTAADRLQKFVRQATEPRDEDDDAVQEEPTRHGAGTRGT